MSDLRIEDLRIELVDHEGKTWDEFILLDYFDEGMTPRQWSSLFAEIKSAIDWRLRSKKEKDKFFDDALKKAENKE